ncbi:AAA family ATPase [Pseudonocardia sp. KRD-184]|uniref:AAA family ATPase n=1 Tax=Pseudonocardia oceani TaxID=2792013 RepID=A0ABS6UAA5_9PSEU|nr:BTAD domain-containing putative transcriptional regulator [Pseudonocardia oceani]MBW0088797.1 AAA family ATPase [Pseudonocardia oceani]MBW0095213.1 AAA family ATPase [Pseudonocardia oceani]MBW0110937.1 AAA family ATPase [Pseudonocardia oceani]MBW0121708.1 AAA family ATPase [Pseudonocardia oceani]MBW0129173.1 AAA family ATPase [Pseudonocardia oceani]
MLFRVLGPLEVVAADGRPVDPGSPKLRALLTLLLADHGRVVPLDRINETLWASEPPATATGTLQSYVSQLRRLLEPGRAPRSAPTRLLTRPPGYLLAVGDDELDVLRFEAMLGEGQRLLDAGRAREADDVLIAALGLWRGEPYADLGDGASAVQADRARLAELRAVGLERHIEAMLADGRPESAVAELERLVAVHPMRERLWGSLMLALYRTGRQADALRAFATCRDLLRDELGIDPGPELRRLERAVLTQDAGVDGPRAPQPLPAPVAAPAADPPRRSGFVGRRTELAALAARLAAAASGTGSVVLLGGEAGIGKTRLAEEVVAAAEQMGARVAWSRCADEAAAPALWPWTQVLRAIGSADGTAAAGGPGDSDSRRAELFERIADALLAAAAERPLLVVLDDLHGADPLSLHLLRFLVGRIAAGPVLVLATLRDTPEERTDALVHTLADLARERAVTRLALGGLPVAEVGELLVDRGLADPVLAGDLRRRTEGNPFFLVELIELLRSERRLDARPGAADIPASVRDVLERRMGRLPADTRALLTMAAVIGREFPLDVLEAASEVDAEQIAALLEPAVLTGVVVEEGDGWVWRFGHELVRETIVAGLTRLQRARLHRRIAQALEGLPLAGNLDALAHHSYLAGPFAGPGTALLHALAAADAARDRFAHATAAEHVARAVELVQGDPRELLVVLGRDRRAAGDLVGAQAALSSAVELALAAGDTDGAAEAAGVFGGVALWNWRAYGTSDAAVVARLDELLAVTTDPVRRAELLGTLACEVSYTDRRAEGVEAARGAARTARDLGDAPLLGRALNNFYLAAWVPGAERERRAALDESLALVGAGLPAHTEAVARLHRGALAMRFAELELSRSDLDHASRLATELGFAELRAQVSYQEAGHATLRGDWDAAERHADEADALQRRTSLWGARWCRIVQRMTVRRGQGRLAEVVSELVDATVDEFATLRPVALLALVEVGETEQARRLLERTQVALPADWSTDFLLCAWGEVAAALGAPDPARLYRDLLPQAPELVVAGTANATWGSVHGVLGRLAAGTGDLPAARAHLAEAVRVDSALGAGAWAGRAREGLARIDS